MALRYLVQTITLLTWIFLSVIFNSRYFPDDKLAEGISVLCFASVGLCLALAIPFLWDRHKEKVRKKI